MPCEASRFLVHYNSIACDVVTSLRAGAVAAVGLTPRNADSATLRYVYREETLKLYFSQFGALEAAEVMKDRYTGKSRGFGFVSFLDPGAATRALAVEHTIDGRRCEAKIALPKVRCANSGVGRRLVLRRRSGDSQGPTPSPAYSGPGEFVPVTYRTLTWRTMLLLQGEPSPPRTTRIFVARIPPSVTEAQFRQYFEGFGKLQDAYMPKDHSKQGYRGIGFVTFASPDSVEKVMAVKHWMNGHEIAIDRATPKEEPTALKNIFARIPMGPNQRRSFDNGGFPNRRPQSRVCGLLCGPEPHEGVMGSGLACTRVLAPTRDSTRANKCIGGNLSAAYLPVSVST